VFVEYLGESLCLKWGYGKLLNFMVIVLAIRMLFSLEIAVPVSYPATGSFGVTVCFFRDDTLEGQSKKP
jgi:hypothetical protein